MFHFGKFPKQLSETHNRRERTRSEHATKRSQSIFNTINVIYGFDSAHHCTVLNRRSLRMGLGYKIQRKGEWRRRRRRRRKDNTWNASSLQQNAFHLRRNSLHLQLFCWWESLAALLSPSENEALS
ncbi:hypothetical protein TorRG33x02_287790 [Trema orientale]|uniref:Uncharacterized protein n=1 Tax=Trema orientale TaxID=63057 RepID=A0A2P5CEX9_TREOI|nr:hypothetical protein TorRG33x02_287790 [Trema orientale]